MSVFSGWMSCIEAKTCHVFDTVYGKSLVLLGDGRARNPCISEVVCKDQVRQNLWGSAQLNGKSARVSVL